MALGNSNNNNNNNNNNPSRPSSLCLGIENLTIKKPLKIRVESPEGTSHDVLKINCADESPKSSCNSQEDATTTTTTRTECISSNKIVKVERRDELICDDYVNVRELCKGNGTIIYVAIHKTNGALYRRKTIMADVTPAHRQQIIRDFQQLHECKSSFLSTFHGLLYSGQKISILTEYSTVGSFADILTLAGRFPEPILSHIAWASLMALQYLHNSLHIIHGNIKPSNMLVDLNGYIKLCDISVSRDLNFCIASSFISTKSYLAPEQILGKKATIHSDIWCLGWSLYEMAIGRYPLPEADLNDYLEAFSCDYKENYNLHKLCAIEVRPLPVVKCSCHEKTPIFQLLSSLVDQTFTPPPSFCFSQYFCDFIDCSIRSEPSTRPSAMDLIQNDFVENERTTAGVSMSNYIRLLTTKKYRPL